MIYADFSAFILSILVPEDNWKKNQKEPHNNKYQKHVACSYGYKIVCFDDKFSKRFKSLLGKDAVYNFISSMVEESKYYPVVMKKYFNKELVMTKEDFNNSTKCWACDNDYSDGDAEVRYHFHTTGKYIGSANRDCNINVKLNHKLNAISNRLEKCISFSINNKLSLIDSFQFLSSLLDSLAKN